MAQSVRMFCWLFQMKRHKKILRNSQNKFVKNSYYWIKIRYKNHTFLQFCWAPGPFLSKFQTCHFRGLLFEMVENGCRKILSFQGIKLESNQCLRSDKGPSSPTTLPSQEQTVQDRHRLSTNLTVNKVFLFKLAVLSPNSGLENFLRSKIINDHPFDYHMNVVWPLFVVVGTSTSSHI